MDNDPRLARALARRDRTPWAFVNDRHVGTVFGLVYHLVGEDRAVAEDGKRYAAAIDYPDSGPTEIDDLGAPRNAKVIDRIPPDSVGRILAGFEASRRQFDDDRAVVVEERVRPAEDRLRTEWRGSPVAEDRLRTAPSKSFPRPPTATVDLDSLRPAVARSSGSDGSHRKPGQTPWCLCRGAPSAANSPVDRRAKRAGAGSLQVDGTEDGGHIGVGVLQRAATGEGQRCVPHPRRGSRSRSQRPYVEGAHAYRPSER